MRALLDELEREFGSFKVFRMNRDVRFSADKSPYKTAHAAVTEGGGIRTKYVQISATGLFVGSGLSTTWLGISSNDSALAWAMTTPERRSKRRSPHARRSGLDIGGAEPALTTAPRGWPKDHPRVALVADEGPHHAA